jgi:hypothetical protein
VGFLALTAAVFGIAVSTASASSAQPVSHTSAPTVQAADWWW